MLIECSECHGRISDQAASCPHCGAPPPGRSGDIKGHQILGMCGAVGGLAIFMITVNPEWRIGGGVLMILGLIGALL